MKIKIEIETGNAAFEDDLEGELTRVIDQASDKVLALVEAGNHSTSLFDINGNRVGSVEIKK